MYLKVHSCKDENLKKEIETAAMFFGLQLLSFSLLKNIKLDIKLKKKNDDMGSCLTIAENFSGKPREFEIILKKYKNTDKMISTLAHEMVHLKQFAKQELNDDLSKWKGCVVDSEKVDYHDLPWEVEAACLEGILMSYYNKYKYFDDKSKKQPVSNTFI